MDKAAASARYAELDKEIWQTVREEFEDVDGEDAVASAVVQVLSAVRGSLDDMTGVTRGLTDHQRAMAEGVAGVLGEVVTIIKDSQVSLVEAAKLTDGARVASAVAKLEKCIEADGDRTRRALSTVAMSIVETGRQIEQLAEVLAAPKRIVTDSQGRPVGVETMSSRKG
jgi:hypothetical protein